jgi:hypothetical protein
VVYSSGRGEYRMPEEGREAVKDKRRGEVRRGEEGR